MKLAVAPRISVGGSLFTGEQLKAIESVLGEEDKVEFTTFKQLYIEVEEAQAEEVKQELLSVGLEVYPAGFFSKNLIACNFCRGAEEAGLATAMKLNELVAGLVVPNPLKIGYAGCANATSEPLFKDIGIVKMKVGFDIYLGGEGKSLKASVGRLWKEGVQEAELFELVSGLITDYQQNGRKKERFSRYVERAGSLRKEEIPE